MSLTLKEWNELKEKEVVAWDRRHEAFRQNGFYYHSEEEAVAELRGIHMALRGMGILVPLSEYPKPKSAGKTYLDPEYLGYDGKPNPSWGVFFYRGYEIAVFHDENSMEDYGRIVIDEEKGILSKEEFSSWNSPCSDAICMELDEFIDLEREKALSYRKQEKENKGG